MVGIFAAQIIDVQGHQGVIRQPLEEFANQIDIKSADRRAGEIDVERQARSTGKVNNHPGQRFVERHISMSITTNSLLPTQRLGHCLSEGNADILDRVMCVDVQIPGRLYLEIDHSMPRHLLEHVVEKRDARSKTALPAPVEIDSGEHLCFQRISGYFCLAHDEIVIGGFRRLERRVDKIGGQACMIPSGASTAPDLSNRP